ncbi:MAG: 3-dehydroquinate synthase II family protein [Deltaproteobacteria bacterium]|jgi:3-dehydroquinate synthase II|nr:3-dehydroquinate synthase II family protein [Deltaproteobacteria bacterium]
MPKQVFFRSVPYRKENAALALEAGAQGLIVPAERLEAAAGLARCLALADESIHYLNIAAAPDEARAGALLEAGQTVVLRRGWEVIPVENLLARGQRTGAEYGLLALAVAGPQEALLAAGILEKGVQAVVVEDPALVGEIVSGLAGGDSRLELAEAEIVEIRPVGLGHRVCVDTLSRLARGQGMLVGNSAAFTFLVSAETEPNEYVAARPFRINAGAVHAYALLPGDRTAYLGDLEAGRETLVVDHQGNCGPAVIGRLKTERRPMLLIRARHARDETARAGEGSVFLQNAETIRLVRPGGEVVSVVKLRPGDKVLCRLDEAGRHFGLRVREEISE